MKFSNILLNTFFLSIASCGVVKRGTGSISDFSQYSGMSELIQSNTASFPFTFKDGPIYSGEGTAYGASTNGGNCLFPKEEYYKDMMYAALNNDQYSNDLGCGACALVVSTSNPYKPIRIRVIDKCPECKHGDLDFSDKAYKALTNQSPGRIKITWALIPCDIAVGEYPALVSPGSPIKFQFKTGSSATWTEVQVYNTRYPVAKVECKVNGAYTALQRREYNYWSNGAGLGAGPFDFRVTLADGSVIEATGVDFAIQNDDEDATAATGTQTGGKSSGGAAAAPVNTAPVNNAPVNNAPVNNTPDNTAPVNNAPANPPTTTTENNTNLPPKNPPSTPENNQPVNGNLPPKNPPRTKNPPETSAPVNNTPSTPAAPENNQPINNAPSTPAAPENNQPNNNAPPAQNNNPWGGGNWFGGNNNPFGNWGGFGGNQNNNNNNGQNNGQPTSPWGNFNWGGNWMGGPTNNAAPQFDRTWFRNHW